MFNSLQVSPLLTFSNSLKIIHFAKSRGASPIASCLSLRSIKSPYFYPVWLCLLLLSTIHDNPSSSISPLHRLQKCSVDHQHNEECRDIEVMEKRTQVLCNCSLSRPPSLHTALSAWPSVSYYFLFTFSLTGAILAWRCYNISLANVTSALCILLYYFFNWLASLAPAYF